MPVLQMTAMSGCLDNIGTKRRFSYFQTGEYSAEYKNCTMSRREMCKLHDSLSSSIPSAPSVTITRRVRSFFGVAGIWVVGPPSFPSLRFARVRKVWLGPDSIATILVELLTAGERPRAEIDALRSNRSSDRWGVNC
jgi:hypothetical protein